jgi:transcriptional regulator with XRE-family HTH domain
MDLNALPAQFLGQEVRRLREERGWTQGELAERIGFSDALIGYIETSQRTPTQRFTAACDGIFETGEYLSRLCQLVRQFATPHAPLPELLESATTLQLSDPLLVPSLMRTRNYAKAVMAASCLPEKNVTDILASRIRLADLLEAKPELTVWAIIDETTLYRPLGGRATLREQCKALIDFIETGRVIIQVLKTTSPMIPLLRVPQVVLGFADGTSLAHVPNLAPNDTCERYAPVDSHLRAFDLLRAAALPPGLSQGAIATAARS